MSIPRIKAEDWRVIYRLLDWEVEYVAEAQYNEGGHDERRVKALEELRDVVAAELVEAIQRELTLRNKLMRYSLLSTGTIPTKLPEAPDAADPAEAKPEAKPEAEPPIYGGEGYGE